MTFKKTGAGCFIWGVFVAVLAALVVTFWYFSEMLPDESRIALSAALSALTIVAVCLICFAVGRLVDFLSARRRPESQAAGIVGDVFAGILLLFIFLVRILYLSRHTGDIADPEGLFEKAMIVSGGVTDLEGTLPALTVGLLRPFLRVAGNRIIVAAVVTAVVQTVMVIGFYYAVRLLAGRTAAFITAGILGFLPTLFPALLVVDDQPLLFALFALTFLVVALYLYFDAAGAYGKPWQFLWFFAVGAVLGGMLWLDFAAVILWIPLLLALALPGADRGAEVVRLLVILAASFAVAVLLLALKGGGMTAAIDAYAGRYFGGMDTVRIFHLPLDSYAFHIVAVTVMSVVIVTFWRDRRWDRTSFWLLFLFAALFFVPLLGETALNGQELFCFGYAAVTGVGAACFVPVQDRRVFMGEAPLQEELNLEIPMDTPPVVPDGMVLPTGDGTDDGVSRMRLPDATEIMTPLGLDRGQERGEVMDENGNQTSQDGMSGEQPLTKAEQKALAKAQKAKAKADAKAAKAEAKAAKKAERERLKMLADAEDEAEELAARGLTPPPAAEQSAQVPPTLQSADAAPQAVQPVPTPQPVPLPVAQAQAPAATGQQTPPVISLAAISPFAGRAPQTSQPNLVRNTAFNADGSDDFDYDISGEDDFDV